MWTNIVLAGLVTPLALAGVLRVTGITAYIGAVLLVLVLLPSNLLRFGWFSRRRLVRVLARLRKPLGVGAGAWFVAHSIVALRFFDLSEPLLGQILSGAMATGVVATLVFVALLATSTDAAQRRLGRNWKLLHRLVWFAVPLSLVHTVLSNLGLKHHVELPGVLLFGGMMAFAAVEYFALRQSRGARSGVWTHAGLVLAGSAVAVFIWAASLATIGPWDPPRPGPPLGGEEKSLGSVEEQNIR